MSRLSDHNVVVAREIIARYPKKKSALIPLVHLSQQQNGYVTEEAMRHVAELIDVTPAEVYGTASFYEMFRFEPTGKYLINVCGTMSCALMGGDDLMHHAEPVDPGRQQKWRRLDPAVVKAAVPILRDEMEHYGYKVPDEFRDTSTDGAAAGT